MAQPLPNREGQQVPDVTFRTRENDEWKTRTTEELFAGQNVIVFSLPGAFTPTCSAKHLPGYVAKLGELKAQGIDMVACLSVNDAWTMQAWAKEHDAVGKIVMLADGAATFSKALGIDADLSAHGMGVRARRGVMMIEDGVVKSIEMEAPGKFEVSSAEACLASFKK
jgi:peroxiredoxin